jgi:hypothetical protein
LLTDDPPPRIRPERRPYVDRSTGRSTSYVRTYGDARISSAWRAGSATMSGSGEGPARPR